MNSKVTTYVVRILHTGITTYKYHEKWINKSQRDILFSHDKIYASAIKMLIWCSNHFQ